MKKRVGKNDRANLNWWYRFTDTKLGGSYYGGDRHHYFELHLESFNSGKKLKFNFQLNRDLDMCRTMDNVFLQIYGKDSHADNGKLEQTIELGDIPFEHLEMFSIALLKVLHPKLLDSTEVNRCFKTL